jgi:hypothetical protein
MLYVLIEGVSVIVATQLSLGVPTDAALDMLIETKA